jgi:hypothetical protein
MWRRMARRPRVAPLLGELARERLDLVEHCRNLALVTREHHALRQRIGDDDQVLRGERLEDDRAAGKDLVVLAGIDLDRRNFLLRRIERTDHPRAQLAQHLVFLRRHEADERGDAVAKQRHVTVGAAAVGQRRRSDHLQAVDVRRVDAVAEQDGADTAG